MTLSLSSVSFLPGWGARGFLTEVSATLRVFQLSSSFSTGRLALGVWLLSPVTQLHLCLWGCSSFWLWVEAPAPGPDRPTLFPVLSLRPEGQVRFLKGGAAGCGLLGHRVSHRLAQLSWASLTVTETWVPGGIHCC